MRAEAWIETKLLFIYLIEELGLQSNRKENVSGFVNKSLDLQLESKEEMI